MLKLLYCPFSLVLFIYSQTGCWFVGVTWPALIWGGGGIFFPARQWTLQPRPSGSQLSILNFFLLASWFIHLLLWKHGGLIIMPSSPISHWKTYLAELECKWVKTIPPPKNANKTAISWTFLLSVKMLCPQYSVCFWLFFCLNLCFSLKLLLSKFSLFDWLFVLI